MPEIQDKPAAVRLTSLSHGGGCGCKLAPSVLEQIIAKARRGRSVPPHCWSVSRPATMPRCIRSARIRRSSRRPTSSCRSWTTRSTSARSRQPMPSRTCTRWGARPLFALALVAMPIDKLTVGTIRRILEGGESVCQRAGIPVAGGHSVDSVEPIYGLVAIGLVDPRNVKRNAEARPATRSSSARRSASASTAPRSRRRDYRRAVPGDDRHHHATQHAGHAVGWPAGCACDDRCDRLRIARPLARGVQRLRRPRHDELECGTAAP